MLEVYLLNVVEDLSIEEILRLSQQVSKEKKERIEKFRFIRDKQNSLLSDLLIRSELRRKTGIENSQLEFSANSYGKPFCVNVPDIHYNISHSGNYIVCAIADAPIGIDVEVIQDADLLIEERFFTEDECRYIFSRPVEVQAAAFYEIWTKKESYIKYLGKGLSIPLKSFSVVSSMEGIYFHKISSEVCAICHVCSQTEEAPYCCTVLPQVLINRFPS